MSSVYGGTLSDVTQKSTGAYLVGTAYFWTSRIGGSRVTGVAPVDTGTVADDVLTTGADFSIQVAAPDGYTAPLLWVSATQDSTRYALHWQPTGPLATQADVAAAVAAQALTDASAYAHASDARLSDQRTPTDGSVTDAKVSPAAGIAQSKIAGLTGSLAAKADQAATTTALAGKADAAATTAALATKADQSAVATALAVKADQSTVTTALATKADLVGGLVPTAQIPALALTTSVPVANQAAMLALTTAQVQPGDVAVRADGAGTFMLAAPDPSQLANWTLLNAPTDKVTSVNGQTATVVLAKADVGLGSVDNTADATKPVSTAQATAIAAKGPDIGSTPWLTTWGVHIDSLLTGAITRDANGAATSASVVWPDNTAGTYTGTASTTWPGAVDSYTVTYAPTGGTTKTVTQPALTRNANGAVTNRPALTVS